MSRTNRKYILFIQNQSHLHPLDEKIHYLLPHIKKQYRTYVETVCSHTHKQPGMGMISSFPANMMTKLMLKAVKFDLVYVRNILDVTLLRGLRLLNHNLVLEISHPQGSTLDLSHNSGEKKNKRHRNIVEKAAKVAKSVLVEGEHQVKILKKCNGNISICPPVFPDKIFSDSSLRFGDDVETVGFGGAGTDHQALKSLEGALQKVCIKFPEIHAIGKSDRFFFLEPPVKYVYRKINPDAGGNIFSDTDIWIQPAKRETADFYGNSIFVLHALAAKKPCVVWQTEIDGNIFKDGKDMFIVSSEDEFIEKLSLLIEDHKLRAKIAENGHKTAQKYFSPEVVADFYIGVFRKTLEEK